MVIQVILAECLVSKTVFFLYQSLEPDCSGQWHEFRPTKAIFRSIQGPTALFRHWWDVGERPQMANNVRRSPEWQDGAVGPCWPGGSWPRSHHVGQTLVLHCGAKPCPSMPSFTICLGGTFPSNSYHHLQFIWEAHFPRLHYIWHWHRAICSPWEEKNLFL